MHWRRLHSTLRKLDSVVCFNFIGQQRNIYSYYLKTNISPSLVQLNALRYSNSSTSKCWNCNSVYKPGLFCSKCKALQEPPENLTYFEIMSIPVNYKVINEECHNKYRELQKLLHPDKFSNKSEREKELSEKLSSLVNKAYDTLNNPLKRGLYMLRLNDVIISEETDNVNAEFLMEIMEKNEEIDDALNNTEKILDLMHQNQAMLYSLSKEVESAFDNKDIKKAEAILIKMKYYDSIGSRLKRLKQDLGIVE